MNRIEAAMSLIRLAEYMVSISGSEITDDVRSRLDEAARAGRKYILYGDGPSGWQIMACRDVRPGVSKGTLGGVIESEGNLSHDGSCWIGSRAQVYGDARVEGDAQVMGASKVYGNATVSGKARVRGNSRVFGNAKVEGEVFGKAQVSGSAHVAENARVGNRSVSSGEITTRDRDPEEEQATSQRPRMRTRRPTESYVWDPGHDNRPRGNGDWHKTERGWSSLPVRKKVWEF